MLLRDTTSLGWARQSLSSPPRTWSPNASGHPHPHQIFNMCDQRDIHFFKSSTSGGSPLRVETEARRGTDVVGEREQSVYEALEWALEESSRQKENLGGGLVGGAERGKNQGQPEGGSGGGSRKG